MSSEMTSPIHEKSIGTIPPALAVPDGYAVLLATGTFPAMDLVGKNLTMNGIDAVWTFPDLHEQPDARPLLFVRHGQQEQALAILANLDLTDFTSNYGL